MYPQKLSKIQPEEEVVLSGIAGRFPESDNVQHLQENLMSGRDLITSDDRRWMFDPELPKYAGKINNIEKFDALFFGVHVKQAQVMDPACRMLLEHTYEAIIDAGINPRQLQGRRTGVFIGNCLTESEKACLYEKDLNNGFGIIGCSRSMLANRLSYWLGVIGPSYTIDTACSSGLCALEHAYRAIHGGLCDGAVVGAANLCLHPHVSLQFDKLGIMSPDGRCKSFDESANGYVRSEAIVVLFLQKAKDAKRIYATVVHGKTNCDGFKEEGITYPSSRMQSVLLEEFYMECGLPPTIVDYVEAHGTASRVGDPVELSALDKVFCSDREKPLKIGSCKSNLGHAEPASGLISVAKAIIAMESGIIPPNLHFKTPRKDIKALVEGRMTVVTESTPLEGKYVGVNSFGYGGANAHILLRANDKDKINNGKPSDDLPRLVTVSGRTEEAVSTIIDYLNSVPVDAEYVRLFHDIHSEDINGHLYRGYTLLSPHGITANPIKQIQSFSGAKRPVCFIFSGVGSQWPGMGKALLRLPTFIETVKNCDKILKSRGLDIVDIISNKKTAFDNPINTYIGVTVIQIGLVNLLHTLGIEPDYVIGHSFGEICCAYADGCFTVEQTLMTSYLRGLICCETPVIRGSMAAVGIGFQQLRDVCPSDIQIACHNSAESTTISGPEESVRAFTAHLQANNVFTKEIRDNRIPYHSRYIAPMAPKLCAYLQPFINEPKLRSSKWLSTSVPIDQWNTPAARYSSAEYHANNMLNPVLFEETSALLPKNAITIEISPHGLFQGILRRSLDSSITNVSLMQRGHDDNVKFMLESLGKIFTEGLNPRLANLYPSIEFPVSRTTPMISPLIKWEHSDDWYVMSYKTEQENVSYERNVKVSLSDPDYKFLSGHIIDGRHLFPFTGYLTLIWESATKIHRKILNETSIIFKNIRFLRQTTISDNQSVNFTVVIQKGTGRFVILRSGAALVTGVISIKFDPATEKFNAPVPADEEECLISDDVYKEFKLRGYNYTGIFQSIKMSTINASRGRITWYNNWTTFLDSIIQMYILGEDSRKLLIPARIKKLVIDVKNHFNLKQDSGLEQEFPVYVHRDYDAITCGGVEIRGLRTRSINRRKQINDPVNEEYKFVPHYDKAELSLREIVRIVTHICLENHLGLSVRTIELIEESDEAVVKTLLSPLVSETLKDVSLIQATINIISSDTRCLSEVSLPENISIVDLKEINASSNALLAIGHQLLRKDGDKNFNLLLSELSKSGFLLTRETTKDLDNVYTAVQDKNLDVILEKTSGEELFILLRKHEILSYNISIVYINNNDFEWIEDMKKAMSKTLEISSDDESYRILFVGQGDFENGLMGFINCLRKEPGGEMVRGLIIQDLNAPKFSLKNSLYSEQLQKDLALNILRENGTWGSYRYLPFLPLEPQFVRHALINQTISNDLSSLRWLEGPILPEIDDKDLVKIFCSSINSRDVMLASGKLDPKDVACKTRKIQECAIGFEYSGIDASGKRIMGLVESKAISNLCVIDRDLAWEVPDDWTLEDAATVPSAYATSYHALYNKGKMNKGDKVLIHEGTGDIGLAALYLAVHEGCKIFTTVDTPEKRRFILEHFPQIQEDHIGSSSDTSFEKMIIQQTNHRGVDIVLNNLDGEKLQASINCLARGGRFLEIGKLDIFSDNPLDMECFLNEISFHRIVLDYYLSTKSSVEKMNLKNLVTEGLRMGVMKPLPRTVFPKNEVEAAFRYIDERKNIGKVIVKVCDAKEQLNAPILALPRYHCHNNRSYIILGGMGGVGLELVDWLVLRGAKYLVLVSRSGIKNGYQRMRIKLWQDYGVHVITITGKNVSQYKDCQFILEASVELAPVDGIFNLMAELKDAVWNNMMQKLFEEQFGCKFWATKHFDELSRKLCPFLRHFVVFSSYSCGRGYPGQTNYGMANSAMERVCEKRVSEGLPGLAIQWGAIKEVGIVAKMMENREEQVIAGTVPQSISSCLQGLDLFLQQKKPLMSSYVVAAQKKVQLTKQSGPLSIVDTVLNIMGLKDLKGASPTTSFTELGMDSIMSLEIKRTLEKEFKVVLSVEAIRNLNFTKLQDLLTTTTNRAGNLKNVNT